MSYQNRRGQVKVAAEVIESNILAGLQLTGCEWDQSRRTLTFYIQDDSLEEVPAGVEPRNIDISTLNGLVRINHE